MSCVFSILRRVGPWRERTHVTVVHPDAVAIVAAPALHDVVREIRFWHLIVGVNDNLEGIKSENFATPLLGHPPLQSRVCLSLTVWLGLP